MDTRSHFPTPYTELNAILRELLESIQAILDNNFVGAYLQGSFAVGDFDEDSDVDFIVVMKAEPSAEQVHALQIMHERIYHLDSEWAKHLEGSYFPEARLRDYAQPAKPLWYLDHGSSTLIEDAHCNTVLVRSVLRTDGVVLAGPHPTTLINPIPVEILRQEMAEVMHRWGRQVLAEPEQMNNWWYQTYAVLQFCRMLHDLSTGRAGSKWAGAEWVKVNLDPSWADLIDRAWAGRHNPALTSRSPANPTDVQRTLAFIQYILNASTPYIKKRWF